MCETCKYREVNSEQSPCCNCIDYGYDDEIEYSGYEFSPPKKEGEE